MNNYVIIIDISYLMKHIVQSDIFIYNVGMVPEKLLRYNDGRACSTTSQG